MDVDKLAGPEMVKWALWANLYRMIELPFLMDIPRYPIPKCPTSFSFQLCSLPLV